MVIPYEAARDAIKTRLGIVLSEAALTKLYGADAPTPPTITTGFERNMKPFSVVVDEVPSRVDVTGAASNTQAQATFSVDVFCLVLNADRALAVSSALKYADCVIGAVLADAMLGCCVDRAMPSITDSATQVTEDNKFAAQITVGITCTARGVCPQEFKEFIG